MISAIRRRIEARICRYVRSRYELIKPVPVQGLFNFRCHENSVEYRRKNPDTEVVEVIYIDGGVPILHYLNSDAARQTFFETTLGWRAEHLEYYLIRRIHPDDHPHITNEFERALQSWAEEFVPLFYRWFFGITRVL